MESPLCLLKLDYDEGVTPYSVASLGGLLRRAGKRAVWLRQNCSGGGKGWHVVVKVTPRCASPMEVVALQAVCGSDVWREAANVLRVNGLSRVPRWWRSRWNVLYKGKVYRAAPKKGLG